jgi:methylase of polypeptide subunit release factors
MIDVKTSTTKKAMKRIALAGGRYAFPCQDSGTAASLSQVLHQEDLMEALRYPQDPLPQRANTCREALQQLFLNGEAVDTDQIAGILPATALEVLARSGLLLTDGGRLRGLFKLQSYQGLVFLSDFSFNRHAPDYVLQIGPAGHYLANLAVRRQVNSVLDLGCGCGVQALIAARHAAHVTATDINPRALALTRLNAELNGISNIEVLQGSYFQPVEGRAFDLIVANLPYVIAPEKRVIYRSTGQPGDASLLRLIRELPSHLNEDGYAHVLANWVHAADASWSQPLQTALEGEQADAWLVYNGSKDPEAYAGMWIGVQEKKDPAAFARTKKAWVEWYRRHKIERIALGALTLRCNTSGPNWFFATEVDRSLEKPASGQIQRLFAARTALASLRCPEDLFTWPLIPLDVELVPAADGQTIGVRCLSGLHLETWIRPLSARILSRLNGKISLQSTLDQVAHEPGFVPDGASMVVLEDFQQLAGLGMVYLA